MDRTRAVQLLRQFFESDSGRLAAAYVFGSVARQSAGPDSDLDVAIIRDAPPAEPIGRLNAELAGRLERHLGIPVDVIDLELAPVDLAHRILRDGVLVHEGDRSRRIAVETRQRSRYFDLQPILAEYRRRKPA
jgi:predicted nucleotidyltransferase